MQSAGRACIPVAMTLVVDGCARMQSGNELRWGSVLIEPQNRPNELQHRVLDTAEARVVRVERAMRLPVPNDQAELPVLVYRAPRLYLHGLVAASGIVLPTVTLGGNIREALTEPPFPEWGDERPWLTALRSTLHQHFSRPLRMQAIARELDIHPVHVSRGFTRRYGVTMTSYLRDLRVMRAGELLLTTNAPVSRIAQSTGFSDHAHLTRVFTARIGVAPSTFRRVNCCAAAA